MENLPDKCLIEIFQYFDKFDLENLTLVCKRFNDVVSNSARLLDEIFFNINNDADIDWSRTRKYRRIKIRSDEETALKLLEHIGDYVTHMNICTNLNYSKRIFDLCPRLEHFVNQDTAFNYASDHQPILNLELLNFKHKLNITRFFNNVTAKTIQLHIYYGVDQSLVDFLIRQKDLEHLELMTFDSAMDLFNIDDLINAEFKLKSLKLFERKEHFNEENFKKFLQNQKSLHKVSVVSQVNTKILNILSEIEHVKELRIFGSNLNFNQMPFIRKLTINKLTIENSFDIAEKFPNLKSLSISLYNNIKIVYDFSNPANNNEQFIEIKIPKSVKTLSLNHISCFVVYPFEYGVIDIDNLILYDCWQFKDWLYEYLMNDGAKFHKLIIRDTVINESQRRYFESLTCGENKKINELKLIGCEKGNKYLNIVRTTVAMSSL